MRRSRVMGAVMTVVLAGLAPGTAVADESLVSGTWTSPQGALVISTTDLVQYQYGPCEFLTFLTGTIAPRPSDTQWVVTTEIAQPNGYVDHSVATLAPETQLIVQKVFCGKHEQEPGTYTVTVTYVGYTAAGVQTGPADAVSGTFTVTHLPAVSTTTLKVKPVDPDLGDRVSFHVKGTYNDGVNDRGEVALQFKWSGHWEPLITLELDERGRARVAAAWKLCNPLKFRAVTVAERRGPPESQSAVSRVSIDERGACSTAQSPREVKKWLNLR